MPGWSPERAWPYSDRYHELAYRSRSNRLLIFPTPTEFRIAQARAIPVDNFLVGCRSERRVKQLFDEKRIRARFR